MSETAKRWYHCLVEAFLAPSLEEGILMAEAAHMAECERIRREARKPRPCVVCGGEHDPILQYRYGTSIYVTAACPTIERTAA